MYISYKWSAFNVSTKFVTHFSVLWGNKRSACHLSTSQKKFSTESANSENSMYNPTGLLRNVLKCFSGKQIIWISSTLSAATKNCHYFTVTGQALVAPTYTPVACQGYINTVFCGLTFCSVTMHTISSNLNLQGAMNLDLPSTATWRNKRQCDRFVDEFGQGSTATQGALSADDKMPQLTLQLSCVYVIHI